MPNEDLAFTDEYVDWIKSLIVKGRQLVEASGYKWDLMPPWALIKIAQDAANEEGDVG